jgi:hypothetical protein
MNLQMSHMFIVGIILQTIFNYAGYNLLLPARIGLISNNKLLWYSVEYNLYSIC